MTLYTFVITLHIYCSSCSGEERSRHESNPGVGIISLLLSLNSAVFCCLCSSEDENRYQALPETDEEQGKQAESNQGELEAHREQVQHLLSHRSGSKSGAKPKLLMLSVPYSPVMSRHTDYSLHKVLSKFTTRSESVSSLHYPAGVT